MNSTENLRRILKTLKINFVVCLLVAILTHAQSSSEIWTLYCGADGTGLATEADAKAALSTWKSACENTLYGGGGIYNGSTILQSQTLDDNGNTVNAYCVKQSCNLCTAAEIVAEKQAIIDSCTTECQGYKNGI